MRIRQGNDFIFLWAIERNELPEDFSNAVNIRLHFKNFDCVGEVRSFQIVDGNIVRVEVSPEWASKLGAYRLILSYEFENNSYSDGDRKCVVDVLAFNIVPKTSDADDVTEMAKTTDIMIGLKGDKGDPFTYDDFTPEQLENIEQPITDFVAVAEVAENQREINEGVRVDNENIRISNESDRVDAEIIREQQEADRQANTATAISNANTATSQADIATGKANTARDEAITATSDVRDAISDTETATINANVATTRANTATTQANTARDKANASALNADNKATLANTAAQNANNATSDFSDAEVIREQQEQARQANTATAISNAENAIVDVNTAKDDYYDVVKPDIIAQGEYAQEQGDYAKSQGDYAKAQGELINESFATFYGVERSRDVADPSFDKIGNLLMHESLPIHNLIRGCKVGKNRKVVNFLHKNTWLLNEDGTPSVLDGTDGLDVLNYYPDMYAILDGGVETEIWAVSTIPFSYKGINAIHINSFLTAPDYITVDRTTNESRCIASDDPNFAGSGSGATAGGIGYPRTLTSRYNYEVYAESKGVKWNNWLYVDYMVLQAYMYIEYKTRNLKLHFPGIGQGWSSANWSAYNGYYPVIKILEAHKNISGNNMTGIYTKQFNFEVDGSPVNYNTGFGVYRGMILWGHLWKWISGIDYEVQSEEDGGQSNVYVQFNPDKIDKNRSDSSFEFMNNYQLMGQASRTGGWAKTTIPFAAQPNTVGGGETTYGCFYFYTSIPTTGVARRGVYFGANLYYGASCALGSALSNLGGSIALASFGGGFRADENKGG